MTAPVVDTARDARVKFAADVQAVAIERGGVPGYGFLAGVCSLRAERQHEMLDGARLPDAASGAAYRRAFGNPIPRLPPLMPAPWTSRYLTWYERVWRGDEVSA